MISLVSASTATPQNKNQHHRIGASMMHKFSPELIIRFARSALRPLFGPWTTTRVPSGRRSTLQFDD